MQSLVFSTIAVFLLLGQSSQKSIDNGDALQLQRRDDLKEIFEKASETLKKMKENERQNGSSGIDEDKNEGSGSEDNQQSDDYFDVPEEPLPYEEPSEGSGSGGSGSGNGVNVEGSGSEHNNEGSGGGPPRAPGGGS